MSSRNRIPDLLEPYLRLPPETSLILLTETLTCNISWLAARFIGSLLSSTNEAGADSAVLLVSWTRDETFWRNEIRRTTTLDPTTAPLHILTLLSPSPSSLLTNVPALQSHIQTTLSTLPSTPKTHLILDTPSLSLALTSPTPASSPLLTLIHTLRSHPKIHSTLITTPADRPFLSATPSHHQEIAAKTKLEVESAGFLAGLVHGADMVLSVRELETGSARGVSGVLRITRGGGFDGEERGGGWEEKELLYFVRRDGGVKVGGRGEVGFEE